MRRKVSSFFIFIVLLHIVALPYHSLADAQVKQAKWKELVKSIDNEISEGVHRVTNHVPTKTFEESYNILSNLISKNSSLKEKVEITKSARRHYEKEKRLTTKSVESIELAEVNDRQILVKSQPSERFQPENHGVKSINISKRLKEQNYSLVKVPRNDNFSNKLQQIRRSKVVEEAEPDYLRSSSYIPQDSQYQQQWYLDRINMQESWDVSRGSSNVTIAVLDSGVNANHPDLQGRVLSGYDFVNNDNNPTDDNGHGTHIAGLIAANSDQIGMAGVDHNAKILPVKVMNEYGQGSLYDILDGIYYAIDNGADIINMSYGVYERSTIEADALWEAYDKGITLIAAAGNDNTNQWSYPASYVPVISVGAIGKDNTKANFSNYGSWIDITAPGTDMFSTNYSGGYKSGNGTSYSAPLISGLAALVKAQHPQWSPDKIEWALEAGAQSGNGSEWTYYDGFGIANAYQSLVTGLPYLLDDASDVRDNAEKLSSGDISNEKINLPMDMDWHNFTIEQSSTVTINLSNVPSNLDLVAVLHKYNGDTLLMNEAIDASGMGGSEQYTIEADPGEYYIQVYDYYNHWSEKPYNLEVGVESNPIDEETAELFVEKEPNGSKQSANSMPFGMIGGGYFGWYEDFDTYEIDLPYNGNVVITTATDSYAYLNTPVALFGPSDTDYFYDYDSLYQDDDGSMKYVYEVFNNVMAGTHYVVLANADRYADTSNPYLFDVSYVDVTGEVAIPEASVPSGTYHNPFAVVMTAQDNHQIKYTLDGTTPSIDHGINYQSPIEINEDTTLKAVSIYNGVLSNIVTREYIVEQNSVSKPLSSHESGTYEQSIDVELTSNDEDTIIMYTSDGTEPGVNHGMLYKSPIQIAENMTVKAVAIKGRTISDIASFNYRFEPVNNVIFPDAEGVWAEDEINYLSGKDLIKGYPNGNFGVTDNIDRASASAIIARELDLSLEKGDFNDVPDSNWASDFIGAAANAGIITGYTDGSFEPRDPLSRSEMAAILVRAYNLKGTSSVEFTDVSSAKWSYQYIEKLVANRITNGFPDNTFKPTANISRAQFSVMVARVLDDSFKAN